MKARRDKARLGRLSKKSGHLSAYFGTLLTIASLGLTVTTVACGERRVLVSGTCQHITPNGAGTENFKEASGEFVAPAASTKLCTRIYGSM